jgi:hypothetical protein
MSVDKLSPSNKLTNIKNKEKEQCDEIWYTMYFRYQQQKKVFQTSDMSCIRTDDRM